MKKAKFPYKPSAQELIAVCFAKCSSAWLSAAPAFAETTDTSTVNAPVVTTETTHPTAENTSPAAPENSASLPHLQHQQQLLQQLKPDTCCSAENTAPTPAIFLDGTRKRSIPLYYKEDGTLVTESVDQR